MAKKIKVIVNAVPLNNVDTGISRYLRCLYRELERQYGERLEIGYFDGSRVNSVMPRGPDNLTRWSGIVEVFWRLPPYPALILRVCMHLKRQVFFRKFVKGFELYHEGAFFPFAVPDSVKTVFTLHDLSVSLFPKYHPRERVLYYRLFLRKSCKNVSHFLTVSRFTQREIGKLFHIPNEKITVTYEGYDPGVFYPRPQEEVEALLSLAGLPRKYFLFVGSGDPRKNIDIIPLALEKAGLQFPLLVAGWQGWISKKEWNNVIFLDYVNDGVLARLYSGALALVFPSSYEGFGLPVLEAMACGCPVVTTREASLPEVAGDSALYMKGPREAEDLAGILRDLVENPGLRQELREKGLRQARKFSWKETAEGTFKVFERVLLGGGA
jgi:glycosyltransferase involved in cell wall biosynthesis